MITLRALCFSLLALIALYSTPVKAEESLPSPDPYNFSKLLWKYKAHDLYDVAALDEYARIHYCPLLARYIQNDFEWENVRSAIRREIALEREGAEYEFEVIDTIALSHYDFDRNAFIISGGDKFRNTGVLRLNLDYNGNLCGLTGHQPTYHPLDVSVNLKNPLYIQEIPVKRDIARKILEAKAVGEDKYGEYFTLRFKLRIISFLERSGRGKDSEVVYYGTIDRFRVYPTPEMKQVLLDVEYDLEDNDVDAVK